MKDWNYKRNYQKNMTSMEALNIIFVYLLISMFTGFVLFFHWLASRGPHGVQIIPDQYFWWVLGAFTLSTLAAIIGRYCADRSIDAE